ncbi:hypothetical protein [Fulvivirga sedimenti]|uniref:Uncharacterized protein n=1 Tax=Fulvivirga sedimenti TaxID=2879465 RepID=A0A9X1HV71_9BACT|nr:hypothetical protein [Fulvivirga sedimenti]MCA6078868.1 hypothetical protein [Fulvivirga sedimenti]
MRFVCMFVWMVKAHMDFAATVYSRFKHIFDGTCELTRDLDFPVLNLTGSGLRILLIALDSWDRLQPDEDYLAKFLDAHSSERWVILWEDIWHHREAIAESRILSFEGNTLRIHGRKCSVKSISDDRCNEFLDQNHLMGSTSAKYRYGLFYQGELVSVATFGRSVPVSREDTEVQSHELIRFCHKMGYHVSGGLSKLIEHFKRMQKPEDIFTSVDREWSEGSGYARIGFREISRTKPLCFYVDGNYVRHKKVTEGIRICNAGNIRMALTI